MTGAEGRTRFARTDRSAAKDSIREELELVFSTGAGIEIQNSRSAIAILCALVA